MLGRVAGVYGVKGWVRIESDTRPRQAILNYSPWQLGLVQGWQAREVEAGQAMGNGLVAKIKGIDDRDIAHGLIGTRIAVPREALPEPAAGEIYWADLVGCSVINQEGIELGFVASLMETGANDVLVVRNGTERLIPYIDQVVIEVDLDQKRIKVDWDEDF